MSTLISVQELATIKNTIIIDCRYSLNDLSYGRTAHQVGHIPGAIFVDLNEDLSGDIIPGKTGRHPLPEKATFVARVRQWGITNVSQVIVYDDANGAFGARCWWMLRWLGHVDVAVLDGGFKAWVEAEEAVTAEIDEVQASEFELKPDLTLIIEADELGQHPGLVTDARDFSRYRGESEPIDSVAGHIPDARCMPFANNLTSSLHFKPKEILQQQFRAFGIPESSTTVCYCGSGVTAAHNILALVHAGYPEPTLYPGSWSEWITDPLRPVATDE